MKNLQLLALGLTLVTVSGCSDSFKESIKNSFNKSYEKSFRSSYRVTFIAACTRLDGNEQKSRLLRLRCGRPARQP